MVVQLPFFLFFTFFCFSYYAAVLAVVPWTAAFLTLWIGVVAAVCVRFSDKTCVTVYIRYVIYLCAGITLGILIGGTVVSLQAKPDMLVSRSSVRHISCTLISDPVPFGSSKWRADAVMQSAVSDCGYRSVARGRVTLILPDSFASAGYAGFGTNRFAADRKKIPQIPAGNGCTVYAHGHFMAHCDFSPYAVFGAKSATVTLFPAGIAAVRIRLRSILSYRLSHWRDAGALLYALLSGNRAYVPESFLLTMKNAGCAHVLALSGMHVSLFFGLITSLIGFAGFKRGAAVPGLAAVAFFIWFAGFSPSLIRSGIMIICGCINRKTHAEIPPIIVLLIVFCIHLVLFPCHGTEISFLLSYTALAGLLLITPRLTPLLLFVLPRSLASGGAASIGAIIGTAFFSVLFFETLYPVGIAASIVIGTAACGFMVAGTCVFVITALFPGLYLIAKSVMIWSYQLIAGAASFFAKWPSVHVPSSYSGYVLAAACVAAGCIFYVSGIERRYMRMSFSQLF